MNEREEGKGMRLLRKGKRGLIQAIFSRLGLIVLLFLLQLALLLGLFSAAAEFFAALLRRNDCVQRHYRHLSAQQRRRPDREVDMAGIFSALRRCSGRYSIYTPRMI